MRTVVATRYVTALREGGSLPGLVEADDDGLYVVKFRGAGRDPAHSSPSGSRARSDARSASRFPTSSRSTWIRRSATRNRTRRTATWSGPAAASTSAWTSCPGHCRSIRPSATPRKSSTPAFAADVVWLDGLVTNPDRTAQNPNLLVWHGRPWLIDHGAALYIHHTGATRTSTPGDRSSGSATTSCSRTRARSRPPMHVTRARWTRRSCAISSSPARRLAAARSGDGRCGRPARGLRPVSWPPPDGPQGIRGRSRACPGRVTRSSTRSCACCPRRARRVPERWDRPAVSPAPNSWVRGSSSTRDAWPPSRPGSTRRPIRPHLDAIERIAAGDVAAGPIARLGQAERFHWLVSPVEHDHPAKRGPQRAVRRSAGRARPPGRDARPAGFPGRAARRAEAELRA